MLFVFVFPNRPPPVDVAVAALLPNKPPPPCAGVDAPKPPNPVVEPVFAPNPLAFCVATFGLQKIEK